jgi:iron(III) transport system substrate-binding protein
MRIILNNCLFESEPMRHILSLLLATSLMACAPSSETEPASGTVDQVDAVNENVVADAGEVNIYTSRHYDTDLALYDDFTEQTGIVVNRIEANANSLIERIVSEGEFSPADLLITVDAGNLWRAEEAGILAPVDSEVLVDRIPANLRDAEGKWFGLSSRARVIIYNLDQGRPEGLSDYEDLADPAYRDQVCMRSSSNIYNISLLSSIISHDGAEAAEAWAQGVVDNFARRPQSNDTGQIEAVASGECRISVVNTYYLARHAKSDDERMREIVGSIGIIFPNQDDRGTHVNISGAGQTLHAPNPENAKLFLEYLTTDSAQGYFANGNNEYPVVDTLEGNSAVKALGTFKADDINVAEFGPLQPEALAIFDRVGWQ